MQGKLAQQNRYRRLLLGCKSVGKTTLLQSLLKAAKEAYPELLTLYVSYAETDVRLAELICQYLRKSLINPSYAIAQFLDDAGVNEPTRSIIQQQELDVYQLLTGDERSFRDLGIVAGMANRLFCAANQPPLFQRLNSFLEDAGKRLFLVVDEFHDVYTSKFPKGHHTISDVHAIGDDAKGRIHCIISGSSTFLRGLAFAKLPKELQPDFPNYKGVDLNSTKYQARWIYPFLDIDSFPRLYETMRQILNGTAVAEANIQMSSEDKNTILYDLFMKSCGSPGCLKECMQGRESSTYHLSTKSTVFNDTDERAKVLLAIYDALPKTIDSPSNRFAIAAGTTRLISVHLTKELATQPENILYEMADAGLIRYITDNPNMKMIGFGSPLVYYTVSNQDKPTIAIFEISALCSPRSPLLAPFAENVACRLLSKAFNDVIRTSHPITYSCIGLNLCKEGKSAAVPFVHYMMQKELMDGRDVFGADAVVLVPSEEFNHKSVAHRIQLKLGVSNILCNDEKDKDKQGPDTAEEIWTRFSSRENLALDAYKRSTIPVSKCTYYLATTRNITPAARKYLEGHNVTVLDKKFLSEHVWTDEIKQLGSPFS